MYRSHIIYNFISSFFVQLKISLKYAALLWRQNSIGKVRLCVIYKRAFSIQISIVGKLHDFN